MHGLDLIAFAKRQAPDWAGIAADYRRGLAIDPARYVPQQAIPVQSRLCTAANLTGLKDHIAGSAYALQAGFAARFADPRLPAQYAWLERPLRQMADLFAQILSERSARAASLSE